MPLISRIWSASSFDGATRPEAERERFREDPKILGIRGRFVNSVTTLGQCLRRWISVEAELNRGLAFTGN